MKRISVAVIGSNGFIGRAVCCHLEEKGFFVLPISGAECRSSIELDFSSIDMIVHCAGISRVSKKDSSQQIRLVNTELPCRLAERAANFGVRRFIFVSSVKVHGEQNKDGQIFTEKTAYAPRDAYAESKMQAEIKLYEIARRTGLELSVLRLPVVYGHPAGGNIQRLAKLIETRLPLPFGGLSNRRSMLALSNLCDVVRVCIEKNEVANQTFLISDNEAVSTKQLIEKIASALCIPVRLFCVDKRILLGLFFLVGRQNEGTKLVESLVVDCSKFQTMVDWTPPVKMDAEIVRMLRP